MLSLASRHRFTSIAPRDKYQLSISDIQSSLLSPLPSSLSSQYRRHSVQPNQSNHCSPKTIFKLCLNVLPCNLHLFKSYSFFKTRFNLHPFPKAFQNTLAKIISPLTEFKEMFFTVPSLSREDKDDVSF